MVHRSDSTQLLVEERLLDVGPDIPRMDKPPAGVGWYRRTCAFGHSDVGSMVLFLPSIHRCRLPAQTAGPVFSQTPCR